MTIRGLNHITLATTNLPRAVSFYTGALGLGLEHQWDKGAYLCAQDLWLCLSLDDHVTRATDYTHIAFDVAPEEFAATCARVTAHGAQQWKENRSEGDSFYFTDPDGHRLELHVGDLASRLAYISRQQDQRAEIAPPLMTVKDQTC
ncbi:MAG: VOC family protein [Rhodobacteraceae bacterium]|nr:VOC family protein [Paracoccaceae bacterium]